MTRLQVFEEINTERERQDRRWGQEHWPGEWVMLAVLMEEVGEVARAMNEDWPNGPHQEWLKTELIHVAAVAVRWLELAAKKEEGR